ncbi:hypothetical protein GCM10023336_68460 [Streptomyces similanensis]|uniref:Transposase n=1 Tax=Streptomyces similanensis TaxID=1274988 RepID=A0ABP9LJN4_9ACTN
MHEHGREAGGLRAPALVACIEEDAEPGVDGSTRPFRSYQPVVGPDVRLTDEQWAWIEPVAPGPDAEAGWPLAGPS